MKRYIVTEKQLQMLKDKLDASYRPIPKEELREWLEDIEAQAELDAFASAQGLKEARK